MFMKNIISNPGGYKFKQPSREVDLTPQPPRIAMRKTYHRAGQYSQLAEFFAAKCKKYEFTDLFIVTF
jgi:hypothetical protein